MGAGLRDAERRELTAQETESARRLLELALRSGSPDLLRHVGRVLSRGRQDASQLGPYAHPHASYLFGLLACDLGGDCGARSEAVRIHCALVGLCGYPNYETLVLDARLNHAEAERVQAHRQILLERIRRGQIDGLFEPVRVPPGP